MRSRIIAKDQAGTPDRWDFPAVDASAADALRGAQKGGAHLLTAGQLDALQKQVHDEAHRRGFDEGLAAGRPSSPRERCGLRRSPMHSRTRSRISSVRSRTRS